MSALDALVDDYLAWVFASAPALATHHGVGGHDDESPDLTAEAIVERETAERAWRDRFAGLDDGDLTFDERIDRDLAVAHLDGSIIRHDWEGWKRNPDTYTGAALSGLFTLFLRRPGTDDDLVAATRARLEAVPALLSAGRANIDAELAPPVFLERAAGQCRAGTTYAGELVPAELPGHRRHEVADAAARAAEAFSSFGDHLAAVRDEVRGDFQFGADRYSAILTRAELLGIDVHELHERGLSAYDELAREMDELAEQVQPGAGWRSAIETINQEHPADPEEMRRGYEDWTARARAFLAEKDLVSFPAGEHCDVLPSPHFQRPMLAVASYIQPASFGSSRHGRFNVPYPPDGTSEEEVQQRLSNNSWQAMPTISVHEAYPGHHWHLVTVLEARPLRRVLRSAYFTEGWGLYVERMMREQGFFTDPRAELCHLDFRLFRAARIIVDTALHTGQMSFDEAVTFMHEKTSMTEPNARAEVGRYCSWPTQASAYLTGSIEIERLRDRWFIEERGTLKAFHDTLAATGAMPISLAERALFGS